MSNQNLLIMLYKCMILCRNLGALRPYLLHVHLNFLILTVWQLWGTAMLSPLESLLSSESGL